MLDRERRRSPMRSQQEVRGDEWKMEVRVSEEEDERVATAIAAVLLWSMASRSATHNRVAIARCCASADESHGMVDHDQRKPTALLLAGLALS